VATSEEIAFRFYSELSRSDRRLVDAWRALGNDYCTALLNSGVLSTTRRSHPANRERTDHEKVEEFLARQQAYNDAGRRRRQAAEHEASHGVTARELGLDVGRLTISNDGSGHCQFETTSRANTAVICVAPVVWGSSPWSTTFPLDGDRGCTEDLRRLAACTDTFGARTAWRHAVEILKAHRADVHALADELVKLGSVVP